MDRDPNKMLCYCLGVRYGRVEETIAEHGCRNVKQVTALCKAGGGCKSCHPEIEELIAEDRARKGVGLRGLLSRLFSARDVK